jgi:hypothetical protein
MKGTTGLGLVATGAILAFAVHAHLPGFHLTATGWIMMLAGVVSLLLPIRRSGWLRSQMVVGGTRAHTLHPQNRPVSQGKAAPGARAKTRQALTRQAPAGQAPARRARRDPAVVAAKILRDAQVAPAAPGTRPATARPRRNPSNRQAPA